MQPPAKALARAAMCEFLLTVSDLPLSRMLSRAAHIVIPNACSKDILCFWASSTARPMKHWFFNPMPNALSLAPIRQASASQFLFCDSVSRSITQVLVGYYYAKITIQIDCHKSWLEGPRTFAGFPPRGGRSNVAASSSPETQSRPTNARTKCCDGLGGGHLLGTRLSASGPCSHVAASSSFNAGHRPFGNQGTSRRH